MKAAGSGKADASKLIDHHIDELGDWRGELLSQLRQLILAASPGMTEEWKWGTPVWTNHGLVCGAGAFKEHVKVHFFKGAFLDDPKGVFNAGLDAKTMRAIDFRKGDKVPVAGLRALVRAAVKYNQATSSKGKT